MTRRESLLAIAGALAATPRNSAARAQTAATETTQAPSGQKSGPAQAAPNTQAEQDFQKFVDNFFDGFFRFHPARATQAGIHKYDSELPSYSRADFEAEITRSRKALLDLQKISPESLSAISQFDARLLQSLIQAHLLELAEIRPWASNPDFYNAVAGEALFSLIRRDFAPIDDRLGSLIARESAVPEILANAHANVHNHAWICVATAIEQAETQIKWLSSLPQMLTGSSSSLQSEFQRVNNRALEAYRQFLSALQFDLAKASQSGFAIGYENLVKKLQYQEMIGIPIERLLAIAETAFRHNQALFMQTAKVIDSSKPPLEIMGQLTGEFSQPEDIFPEINGLVSQQQRYLASHPAVTIPAAATPQAADMPPYLRSLRYVAMDAPGPFETKPLPPYIEVTLPDPDWDEQPQAELMRRFNHLALKLFALREAYPGSYVQDLWLERAPSRCRKLAPFFVRSRTASAGWSHYCEEMMLEQGYSEGDPNLLMMELQSSLIALGRLITAIRMHAKGMTYDQAVSFFQSDTYLDPLNARSEAALVAMDPGSFGAALGKLEIQKLREDYKQNAGSEFELKSFHDRFLGFGPAPVSMVRQTMLGRKSPAL